MLRNAGLHLLLLLILRIVLVVWEMWVAVTDSGGFAAASAWRRRRRRVSRVGGVVVVIIVVVAVAGRCSVPVAGCVRVVGVSVAAFAFGSAGVEFWRRGSGPIVMMRWGRVPMRTAPRGQRSAHGGLVSRKGGRRRHDGTTTTTTITATPATGGLAPPAPPTGKRAVRDTHGDGFVGHLLRPRASRGACGHVRLGFHEPPGVGRCELAVAFHAGQGARVRFGAAMAAADTFDFESDLGAVVETLDAGPFRVAEICCMELVWVGICRKGETYDRICSI